MNKNMFFCFIWAYMFFHNFLKIYFHFWHKKLRRKKKTPTIAILYPTEKWLFTDTILPSTEAEVVHKTGSSVMQNYCTLLPYFSCLQIH